MHNLVLACKGCNETRGNYDHYCDCVFCHAAYDVSWVDKFEAIVNFNTVRVWRSRTSKWAVNYRGEVRVFKRWDDAMDYANARIERAQILYNQMGVVK